MNWNQWAAVLTLGFVAGTAGAYLYLRWNTIERAIAPYWRNGRRWLQKWRPRRAQPVPPPQLAHRPRAGEETVVIMPDGRPWPLGPALQLLEFAWRWQVVHGANLPARARQGEGAYVWRPPLPARGNAEHPGAEAER